MLKRSLIIIFLGLLSFSAYSEGIKCTLKYSYNFEPEKDYCFFKQLDKDQTLFRLDNLPENLKGVLIQVWAKGPRIGSIKYIDEEYGIFNLSGDNYNSDEFGTPKYLVIAYPRGEKRLTIQLECDIKDHI